MATFPKGEASLQNGTVPEWAPTICVGIFMEDKEMIQHVQISKQTILRDE